MIDPTDGTGVRVGDPARPHNEMTGPHAHCLAWGLNGFICTLNPGHNGPHVAESYFKVEAVWIDGTR